MDWFTAAACTALGVGMGLVVGTVWGVPGIGLTVGGLAGVTVGGVLGSAWRG